MKLMNLRSVGNLGWTEVLWLAVRAWKGEITTAELLVRREYFCHWNLGMKLKLRAAHLSRCHFPLELSWVCACLPCLLPSTLHPDQACSLQCLNKKLLRCGGETGCSYSSFCFCFFFANLFRMMTYRSDLYLASHLYYQNYYRGGKIRSVLSIVCLGVSFVLKLLVHFSPV